MSHGLKGRRLARDESFKALYRHGVVGEQPPELVAELKLYLAQDPDAADYAAHLITLFGFNQDEVDAALSAALDRWTLDRVAQTDRAVLRLAATELFYSPDVPFKVVIDEAIELARRYGTDASGRFVNGVLDSVHRTRVGGGAPAGPGGSGAEAAAPGSAPAEPPPSPADPADHPARPAADRVR